MSYTPGSSDGLAFLPILSLRTPQEVRLPRNAAVATWRFPIVVPDTLASLTFFPVLPTQAFFLKAPAPYQERSVFTPILNPVVPTPFAWNIQRPTRLHLLPTRPPQQWIEVTAPPSYQVVVAQSLAWIPQGREKTFRALDLRQPSASYQGQPLNPLLLVNATGSLTIINERLTATTIINESATGATLIGDTLTATTLTAESGH